jgi:hypothetical protein
MRIFCKAPLDSAPPNGNFAALSLSHVGKEKQYGARYVVGFSQFWAS